MKNIVDKSAQWVPTIVIIDDDTISNKLLSHLLYQEGFTVLCAQDGAFGRSLVLDKKPDLVLLDMYMPGENGIDTCKKLKNNPLTSDIPIIFLTAEYDVAIKVDCFGAGAVDFITKPFHPLEVLARVRVQIRIRRAFASVIESQIARINQLAATQKMIMPTPDQIPDARFAVYYKSFHEAGGDFYDVMPFADGVYDYIVADVCSHDLGSSLFTSALKVLLHEGRLTLNSPMETLSMVNQTLRAAFSEEKFMSLAYARLNRQRDTLTTISAGHPPIIYWNEKDHSIETLPCRGDVLGVFDSMTLTEHTTNVTKGDRFFMYTDGLIEHAGMTRRQGIANLAAQCTKLHDTEFPAMVDTIVQNTFSENHQRNDDILFLGVIV